MRLLLISFLIPWLSFAQVADYRHIELVLETNSFELSEKFVNAVVVQMNKDFKSPDFGKKYNKKLAEIDRSLSLSKNDIKPFKAVKDKGSSIRLYYKSDQYLTMDLGKLGQGVVFFNGEKILWKDMHNSQRLHQFIKKNLGAKKVSRSYFFNDAHADAFALVLILGTAGTVGIGMVLAAVDGLLTIGKMMIGSTPDSIVKFENTLKEAVKKCDDDKDMITSGKYAKDESVFNETLQLLQVVEKFPYKTLERYEKAYDKNMFSCKNIIGIKGERFKTPVFGIPLYKRVGAMCNLAKHLEDCLNETKDELAARGLNVDDSMRSDTKSMPDYYKTIVDQLSKAAIAQ